MFYSKKRKNQHKKAGGVLADIPGIIEGAAEGAGLGHDFLRHIDRCRLLIHVVDVSGSEGRDPVADFEAINEELKQYSPELAGRKMIVAANKVDIMTDPGLLDRLRAHVEGLGLELVERPVASEEGNYARHDPDKLAQAVLEIYRGRAVRIFHGARQYILEE